MAAYSKFNSFVEALAEGVHDFSTDTLKIALSNTAPSNTNTQFSEIVEITPGNGYTAGGATATTTSSSQSGGTYRLICSDVIFTATGTVGPLRYAVIYNDSAPNKELVGFWDYGSSVTLSNGDTFTVDLDDSNGVLSIA